MCANHTERFGLFQRGAVTEADGNIKFLIFETSIVFDGKATAKRAEQKGCVVFVNTMVYELFLVGSEDDFARTTGDGGSDIGDAVFGGQVVTYLLTQGLESCQIFTEQLEFDVAPGRWSAGKLAGGKGASLIILETMVEIGYNVGRGMCTVAPFFQNQGKEEIVPIFAAGWSIICPWSSSNFGNHKAGFRIGTEGIEDTQGFVGTLSEWCIFWQFDAGKHGVLIIFRKEFVDDIPERH